LGGIILRLIHLLKLFYWVVIFEAIAFLLGLLTKANIDPWYNSLNKSSLTPPGIVFSIVWSLFYGLLAYIAWFLSRHKKESGKLIIYLYGLQMVMNWAWTPLFFQFHWIKLSAVWLIILTCLNWVLMAQIKTKQKPVALLLLPYVLWLMFASYLNVFIAVIN
jgi:tryptophan-rich sensory protein